MYSFKEKDTLSIYEDALQTQIDINNSLSKRIGVLISEKADLKCEYIEGQNNLVIYLREVVKQKVIAGEDFGGIVCFINNLKPIFKHD